MLCADALTLACAVFCLCRYNNFFHKTLPTATTIFTTLGSLYGAYLCMFKQAER